MSAVYIALLSRQTECIILLIKRHLQYVPTKSNVILCCYYKHFCDYIKNTPKSTYSKKKEKHNREEAGKAGRREGEETEKQGETRE